MATVELQYILNSETQRKRPEDSMWYSRVDTNQPKGASSLMDSITQDMKYRCSLMKYAEKYGVSRASRKYDKSRSYIYFWRKRFDGTIESLLACRSRRPHSHPNQHTPEEIKLKQKNAPEKSKAGDCRAMGTAEKPRV